MFAVTAPKRGADPAWHIDVGVIWISIILSRPPTEPLPINLRVGDHFHVLWCKLQPRKAGHAALGATHLALSWPNLTYVLRRLKAPSH